MSQIFQYWMKKTRNFRLSLTGSEATTWNNYTMCNKNIHIILIKKSNHKIRIPETMLIKCYIFSSHFHTISLINCMEINIVYCDGVNLLNNFLNHSVSLLRHTSKIFIILYYSASLNIVWCIFTSILANIYH